GVATALVLNFADAPVDIALEAGAWEVRLDSHDGRDELDEAARVFPKVRDRLRLLPRQAVFLVRVPAADSAVKADGPGKASGHSA
ncbi:MAG: hypothetical protein IJC63_03900, partial [Myxococcaceae bacterium]|nr:hypothetical protein [Myxococcaceae bacterium]